MLKSVESFAMRYHSTHFILPFPSLVFTCLWSRGVPRLLIHPVPSSVIHGGSIQSPRAWIWWGCPSVRVQTILLTTPSYCLLQEFQRSKRNFSNTNANTCEYHLALYFLCHTNSTLCLFKCLSLRWDKFPNLHVKRVHQCPNKKLAYEYQLGDKRLT